MSVPIRVEHVTKAFGQVKAVDDVSFETGPGELFFLLGPSGCGKTTLLRAVAGFAEIDAGEIYIGERRLTNVPPHKRRAAMVFQNYALWPHMTVLENVTFGLELRGLGRRERKAQGTRALEIVRLAELAARKPNQLSGGQQQRVALARALAIEPECLLLDEPLSNLDAQLRLEMRSEIRRIHDETRLTILYVTHDQKEALSLAERIALMREGRIEQIGAPRELYHNPGSLFAAGFLGEANFLSGLLLAAEGGLVQVETSLGLVKARPAAAPLAVGQRCVVFVRPETLELWPRKVIRPQNGLEAEVEEVSFLGELDQLVARAVVSGRPAPNAAAGGRAGEAVELKALAPAGRLAAWKHGDRVWVSFAPEAAGVFAAEEVAEAQQ